MIRRVDLYYKKKIWDSWDQNSGIPKFGLLRVNFKMVDFRASASLNKNVCKGRFISQNFVFGLLGSISWDVGFYLNTAITKNYDPTTYI